MKNNIVYDKLTLVDGTEIKFDSAQGISAITIEVVTKAEAYELWEKFTRENLEQITIINEDGLTIGIYNKMVLDRIEAKETDGHVAITFCLRPKTREEILEERVSALEKGQNTQDEAIEDLGQAVSDMAAEGSN